MATKKETTEEFKPQGDVDVSALIDLGTRVSRSTIAVIDTVVTRGAFKGEELSTIGQLRDHATQLIQIIEGLQSESASN